MTDVSKIILAAANIPILVTCIYAILRYQSFGRELKAFSWFIFLSGIIQLTCLILWFYSMNNMLFLHVYTGFGFICLAWFYGIILEDFIPARIIRIVSVLFFIFNIISSFFYEGIFSFNSLALTVESVLVVIFSLSTYIFLLNEYTRESRKDLIKSLSWINAGLFIYFSSSILLFYFGEMIMHSFSKGTSRHIWIMHSFFSTVMYICFFTGLWKRPKN